MTHPQKIGGGYGGPVTILCRFFMSDGAERFVVGFKPEGGYGECAHIFARAQLAGVPALTSWDRAFEQITILDRKASPGILHASPDLEDPDNEDRWFITDGQGNLTEDCALNKRDALFWTGLVNLYRSGQLVPRSHLEHYMQRNMELALQVYQDPAFNGTHNTRIAE